ncbi:hypothetical protein BNJ_00281 [Kaumoebavirus]|uniref:hypothetical protein n=1 Tax=Kaumoebavirus TaxID=1859492 RepID=UPI0009C1BB84|nr:hypothetical protein BNJ_00281 [Kaumoebavirus]ARA72104.1 hypothetical protein BNJ_00281 [Kaumoebavirus]
MDQSDSSKIYINGKERLTAECYAQYRYNRIRILDSNNTYLDIGNCHPEIDVVVKEALRVIKEALA